MVMGALKMETELAVIGSGPGGYVAAIRAADLGREVVLIEERADLGGVCLGEGCIPSKTLINAVEVIEAARQASQFGVDFDAPRIDLDRLRAFTKKTVSGLSQGVGTLLKHRGVEVLHGRARFNGPNSLAISGGEVAEVNFKNAIIATGSRARTLELGQGLPVWDSSQALSLPEIPQRMLVIGGGYIGLELGLVYAGLGSQLSLLETAPRLLGGADPDLVEVMLRVAKKRFQAIEFDSQLSRIESTGSGARVFFTQGGREKTLDTDRILVSVGRQPNTADLGLENIGLELDRAGQIAVDEAGRTASDGVWAIGDVVPGPMLAHKASREAKVAAEAISGHKSAFDNRAIPAVIFTDPEIAWAGLREEEAQAQNLPHRVGRFPLRALGRARTLGRTDGLVKVISRPEDGLVLGVGMVGPSASELISEAVLAIEMGATLEDLLVSIHPHPTLSEAIAEAAEIAAGQAVHVLPER